MRYILLLIFTLLFTACNSTTLKNTPAIGTSPSLPVSKQDTDINDLKIIDEASIVGEYTLKRGLFRNQEITEGYLVIEEIDVHNYGYYYVTIAEKLLPETHTGIFFKKGGHFVQKVIEDSSEEEIRQGKGKSKISIIDNIQLIKEDELLKLYINSDKKEKLIWERDREDIEKSDAMVKSLKDAQEEYKVYYQEKCKVSKNFCGDEEYTKVNE